MLAYLPDRSTGGTPELTASSIPERAERWIHGAWLFVVGSLSFAIVLGLLAGQWPILGRLLAESEAARKVAPVIGAAILLVWVIVYGLAIFMLIRDRRLPARSRAPWLAALIFFNFFAALVFVPWRWFVVRRHALRTGTA